MGWKVRKRGMTVTILLARVATSARCVKPSGEIGTTMSSAKRGGKIFSSVCSHPLDMVKKSKITTRASQKAGVAEMVWKRD